MQGLMRCVEELMIFGHSAAGMPCREPDRDEKAALGIRHVVVFPASLRSLPASAQNSSRCLRCIVFRVAISYVAANTEFKEYGIYAVMPNVVPA